MDAQTYAEELLATDQRQIVHSWGGDIYFNGDGRMYADPDHTIDITDAWNSYMESQPLSEEAQERRRWGQALTDLIEMSQRHVVGGPEIHALIQRLLP